MEDSISKVVIVGGGSAGWLAAGVIAAEHRIDSEAPQSFELLLIESPDVPTIGVGEGTWPSMRTTLQRIGLSETDFIRECDASFKQGTYFRNWHTGDGDTYSHPFTVPAGFAETNLVPHWLALTDAPQFADAVTPQTALFSDCLAPKQITTPEYAFLVNYGYHLDAGKFAELLRRHCTEQLGVKHIQANVSQINAAENGDIQSVTTDCAGDIAGDLFIDCTGTRSLLLGEHFKIPFQPLHRNAQPAARRALQDPVSAPTDVSVQRHCSRSAGAVHSRRPGNPVLHTLNCTDCGLDLGYWITYTSRYRPRLLECSYLGR
jgi:glycine/D-amino acid oxidase-like deaminating enzyme